VQLLNRSQDHVRWRSESDRGQSHALNKAFLESKGDYIGWLNSDDAYVDRRAVQAAVETFERYPDVGLLYGQGLLVNQHNRVLQYLWAPPFIRSAMERHTYFVQPSVFLRRSVIEPPFVDERLHFVMDRDLWLRLLNKTKFMRLNMIVGLDRYQPSRKTLTGAYHEELNRYTRAHVSNPDSRLLKATIKTQKILFRLRGSTIALQGVRGVDPAIDLHFGTVRERLVYQLCTPRRKMPLD
jgi:glycosyltransferase involved in cell wall biosynthesis